MKRTCLQKLWWLVHLRSFFQIIVQSNSFVLTFKLLAKFWRLIQIYGLCACIGGHNPILPSALCVFSTGVHSIEIAIWCFSWLPLLARPLRVVNAQFIGRENWVENSKSREHLPCHSKMKGNEWRTETFTLGHLKCPILIGQTKCKPPKTFECMIDCD